MTDRWLIRAVLVEAVVAVALWLAIASAILSR